MKKFYFHVKNKFIRIIIFIFVSEQFSIHLFDSTILYSNYSLFFD